MAGSRTWGPCDWNSRGHSSRWSWRDRPGSRASEAFESFDSGPRAKGHPRRQDALWQADLGVPKVWMEEW